MPTELYMILCQLSFFSKSLLKGFNSAVVKANVSLKISQDLL